MLATTSRCFRITSEEYSKTKNIGARKSFYSSGSARCFLLQKRARFISEISKSLWNINQFFDSNFEGYTSLHFRDFQPFERTLKIRKCDKLAYSFNYIIFEPLWGTFYHYSTMVYAWLVIISTRCIPNGFYSAPQSIGIYYYKIYYIYHSGLCLWKFTNVHDFSWKSFDWQVKTWQIISREMIEGTFERTRTMQQTHHCQF